MYFTDHRAGPSTAALKGNTSRRNIYTVELYENPDISLETVDFDSLTPLRDQ